jgi:hypothetical protein
MLEVIRGLPSAANSTGESARGNVAGHQGASRHRRTLFALDSPLPGCQQLAGSCRHTHERSGTCCTRSSRGMTCGGPSHVAFTVHSPAMNPIIPSAGARRTSV